MREVNGKNNLMEKIVGLCKRRGFIFPGSEIYGGLANSWDYGPLGVELKNNIKQLWWRRFVQERDDIVGIDAALIMNSKVWEASGHLKNFTDPLVECQNCHNRFRADHFLDQISVRVKPEIPDDISPKGAKNAVGEISADDLLRIYWKKDVFKNVVCDVCGKKGRFTKPTQFNLMLETFLGPSEASANVVYFRPETAQAMFVDFKNVLDTSRKQVPFGIAQIGKAFRNEITPGNFIFRTREFEQMEIEYFIRESVWEEKFEYWRTEMENWMAQIGLTKEKIHAVEIGEKNRAFYSKKTIDFEYEFPFGQDELYGLAYRADFDLKNHYKEPPYKDSQTGEEFWPHVIEPTWGVDRTALAILLDSYDDSGEHVILKLKPNLAPYKAAVFPLLANKPELVKLARKIYDSLRKSFMVAWDDRGNIGKRYYSQDEIGTPFCITIDFDSLEKNDATVRYRDTGKQERVLYEKLEEFISARLADA